MKFLKDIVDVVDGVTGAFTHPLGEMGREMKSDFKSEDKKESCKHEKIDEYVGDRFFCAFCKKRIK